MTDAVTTTGATPAHDDRLAARNAILLSVSQAFYGINAITVFTLASILGNTFADDKSLATLPVTAMVLGCSAINGARRTLDAPGRPASRFPCLARCWG